MNFIPLNARRAIVVASFAVTAANLDAQIQRPGRLNETYARLCAACHGAKMEGAQAPSMLDDVWTHGGDDESLAKSIRMGFPEKGMPAWSAALPEQDIRAMVIFIREQRAVAQKAGATFVKPAESITVKSELHSYQVNTWVDGVTEPWSMAFLPGNRALVTEKRGRLYSIENGKLAAQPITGTPEVDTRQQAGLYDVVPHPDFARNGWIYLAYSDPKMTADGRSVSLTKIVRGKLNDGAWVEQQTIFEAPVEVYPPSGGVHFGGRMVFDRRGYLFFTIGERGTDTNAQNLAVPMGKVHRIFDDGRIPDDNPFAKDANAFRTIWSYGHRNPQGLAMDPVSGGIYDVEHGPRGGDELNHVVAGKNYGWPVITYGMNYDGRPITDVTAKPGMEQPMTYWVPSIAPCGISFYAGDLFPKWKNHLFVAALATQELRRLEIKGDKVVAQELLFKDLGRIRHVTGGPDGALYVLLPTRIARISPAAE